jgi:hypothetical protein
MDNARAGDDLGMGESLARVWLARMAEADPPPSRVNVERARSRGRRALRRRRAGQAGAPAMAVLAVIVVLATSGSAFRPAGTGHGSRRGAERQPAVSPVRQFNPLVPYAAFGWLPPGESLNGGQLSPPDAYLTAGPGNAWALTVWAQGRCQRSGVTLNCAQDPTSGSILHISGRAPRVAGHPAFWLRRSGGLVWRYARRSWAVLAIPGRRDAVKVASHVRYAIATRPSIEFPVQLTAMSPAWQVAAIFFVPVRAGGRTVLRASEYSLTGQPGYPALTTDPATAHDHCYVYPDGQSARRIIDGYHVVVTHIPAAAGRMPVQQVCAAHADGLMIFISTYGRHPALGAVAVFTHHTRLLGPEPARWTTRPLT